MGLRGKCDPADLPTIGGTESMATLRAHGRLAEAVTALLQALAAGHDVRAAVHGETAMRRFQRRSRRQKLRIQGR